MTTAGGTSNGGRTTSDMNSQGHMSFTVHKLLNKRKNKMKKIILAACCVGLLSGCYCDNPVLPDVSQVQGLKEFRLSDGTRCVAIQYGSYQAAISCDWDHNK
jgi:hypothetical protein